MRRTLWAFCAAAVETEAEFEGFKPGTGASKEYKTKVPNNADSPHIPRYFHNFWQYRCCQLTTGNIRAMGETAIGDSGSTPVHSDLQPHGLYRFRGEKKPHLCVAVPVTSTHAKNLQDCSKASLMAGHTDPQIYHWFKLLGTVPPRSIASGKVEVLSGDLLSEVWDEGFVRHPLIHEMAQKMWEDDESKTEDEQVTQVRREQEEDEKRMLRMTNVDWRAKHKARERNPTAEEDVERPIYVMKSDQFVVARLKPEVQLYGDYGGKMQRVWEQGFPDMDALARYAPRFIKNLNLSRQKLVASLNINYNLKLTNVFIFGLDSRGLWAMGTQENFAPGERETAREHWSEFRFEYGKDQVIETAAELEWWTKGLMRLGTPETSGQDSNVDEQIGQQLQ